MNNQVNECFQQISVLNFFCCALNLMIFSGRITCPVESFLKYQSKLNKELPWLWQRPADSFYPDDETWFQKSPLGKNTLSSMMSKISRQGELSRRYTNHSIRSTAITVLDEAGVFKFFILNFYF